MKIDLEVIREKCQFSATGLEIAEDTTREQWLQIGAFLGTVRDVFAAANLFGDSQDGAIESNLMCETLNQSQRRKPG